MSKEFELFVPGRLCILGEHTDWAAIYREQNASISKGYTIVCATNEGLYAKVKSFDNFTIKYTHRENGLPKTFEMLIEHEELSYIAAQGGFYCYVAGTTAAILECPQFRLKYPDYTSQVDKFSNNGIYVNLVSGISIDNHLTSLPMKKGLSSSAAICVLIATAFNQFYKLNLTSEDLMDVAYKGEMKTPSRCGRMDQCVVMGPSAIALMEFNNSTVELRRLACAAALHFVVANLNAHKDTMVILKELNECFPVPKSENQVLMHEYVSGNVAIAHNAVAAIESGDVHGLAASIRAAQDLFDKCVAVNCPSQLTSPVLHSVMNDTELQSMSLAIKGVGSQGDGSVQFLCESSAQQQQVLSCLRSKYRMEGFTLNIGVTAAATVPAAEVPAATASGEVAETDAGNASSNNSAVVDAI